MCNHLFKESEWNFIEKLNNFWEAGKELFIKYNYYIIILAFILLIIGLNFNNYLLNLNYKYNINSQTFIEYKTFLQHLQLLIKGLFWILVSLYIYAFIGFLFASFHKEKNTEDNKPITLDALIINLIYFLVLLVESQSLGKTTFNLIYYAAIFTAFLSLVYFICTERYKTNIKSPGILVFKTITFSILAFFIINYQNLILTNKLINLDIKNNISVYVKKGSQNKKNELLNKLSSYLKKYNITDRNITINTNKSELHIIIHDIDLLKD